METENNTTFTPAPIPTEQELASFDHRQVPGPVEVIGDVRIAAEPSLAGLPPEMQDRVRAKLATVRGDRDIFERQFVMEELQANSYRLKVLAGPGKDANEYEREAFGIAREVYDLQAEAMRIEAELADVVGHRTEYDGSGKAVAVPIPRLQHEMRRGREAALLDVRRRIRLLEGHEGQRRRSEAAKRTQERIAAQNEQLAVMAEAKAQTAAAIRKARVDKLVAAFVKNRQHTID